MFASDDLDQPLGVGDLLHLARLAKIAAAMAMRKEPASVFMHFEA